MDRKDKVVRNQIDFILVRRRFRNSIISAKTYPGADIGSDHNPVCASIKMKYKKIKTANKKEIDTHRLRDPQTKSKTADSLNKNIDSIKQANEDSNDVHLQWKNFKQSVTETAKQHLKPTKRQHKEWMTEEILSLMNERKKNKNNNAVYKNIDRTIKSKIREAKQKWLSERCEEIEELDKKYDSLNVHKKIKEMTGVRRSNHSRQLKDKNGTLITDMNKKVQRWKEYIEDLFNDEQRSATSDDLLDDTGPDIMREELEYALKHAKKGKAAGPDDIPVELLKLMNDDSISILLKLFNLIYKTGIIPKDWLQSTFVAIPKKANAKECSDHRTISLMSHTLKLFLKIIHNRIYKKLEMDISETQMGFRKGMGTREALFAINVLSQRCMDMNQELYVCFIDFEKAFDKVRHDQLKRILKNKNIDDLDIRIICNLYWNQTARVKVENMITEEIEIRRGVRQGCILSPLLFNIYSESVCQEALSEADEGITVNGETLNNVRYADDTVLLAESLEDLQHLVERLNNSCNKFGLKINLKKTKFMVMAKSQNNQDRLLVNNISVEKVNCYKYLGTWLNENTDQTKEIKTRIEISRSSFNRMRKLFCNRDLSLVLRLRMLRCYVFSTLLYGVEAWTLRQNNTKSIEAFEMWCYRRILKVSWIDRVTNNEILQRLNKAPELMNTIKKRKLEYLGHVLRGERYSLLRNIMQGKIKGKRNVGRRRISWLRNLRDWFGCSSIELFRRAANKVRVAVMISNLR